MPDAEANLAYLHSPIFVLCQKEYLIQSVLLQFPDDGRLIDIQLRSHLSGGTAAFFFSRQNQFLQFIGRFRQRQCVIARDPLDFFGTLSLFA